MSINKSFLAELHHESGLTRKVLQRISADHLSWTPHQKSMTLSRLATHVADIHGWPVFMLGADELDVAKSSIAPVPLSSPDAILQSFEQKLSSTMAAMESADDELMGKPWTFRHGEHVIFTMPRKQVLRGMVMNHIIHHRGQLTVYLRMLDIPVPSVYGPSADEQVF